MKYFSAVYEIQGFVPFFGCRKRGCCCFSMFHWLVDVISKDNIFEELVKRFSTQTVFVINILVCNVSKFVTIDIYVVIKNRDNNLLNKNVYFQPFCAETAC